MVLYHYDSYIIIFQPMKNRSDIEAIRVYEYMYKYLKACNCKSKFNIIDNKASTDMKRYITDANVNYQLFEPDNQQVNSYERVIRTFKNNFVAGLSSVHPKLPMHLWDELLPQAFITLNLLQTSRTCPKISAYSHIYGTYNFDTTTLAPPGVRS